MNKSSQNELHWNFISQIILQVWKFWQFTLVDAKLQLSKKLLYGMARKCTVYEPILHLTTFPFVSFDPLTRLRYANIDKNETLQLSNRKQKKLYSNRWMWNIFVKFYRIISRMFHKNLLQHFNLKFLRKNKWIYGHVTMKYIQQF